MICVCIARERDRGVAEMSALRWILPVLVIVSASAARGAGLLLPKDESLIPLAIKHQRVDIDIKDGVADVRIEQVFKNSVSRDLEAVYVFPLPPGASVADFAMYIDGKRVSGELLEKDKARRTYEDIVRRMKDPGLLEYMGGTLFKIRVYPVRANSEQKIEVAYSQTLEFDAGLYKYLYPLKTSGKPSSTLADFTVSLRLSSSIPIKNIYSPTHRVGISRKNDHEAVIGFEEDRSSLDRDFVLYYGVSKKEFGLNLLTHGPEEDEGYFMMMLAPFAFDPDAEPLKKDVVFVIDTSGSMEGEKIGQARSALKYCVRKLNAGDRFNIIRFSTDVEPLADELLEVTEAHVKRAEGFTDTIEARGGTAIDEALRGAVKLGYSEDRPAIVVFLTDGKPTVGESDTGAILANIRKSAAPNVRVFVFGVGEKVNTHLLDLISGENGGFSEYVRPKEEIEVKLSSFADKISSPVLAGLDIHVGGPETSMIYPRRLPDLFAGDQLTIFGRYEGDGEVEVTLSGTVNGERKEFTYGRTISGVNMENAFIPRLWATRRIGFLLDQIRLHGRESELRDEVTTLSKEYGIITPYTSFLIIENEMAFRYRETGEEAPPPGIPPPDTPVPFPVRFFADAIGSGGEKLSSAVDPGRMMARQSGAPAVEMSRSIRDYREMESLHEDVATVRHVDGKTFFLDGGRWVDGQYREGMKTRSIAFASAEYFELLETRPELRKWFALGERVTVVVDGSFAVVVVSEHE